MTTLTNTYHNTTYRTRFSSSDLDRIEQKYATAPSTLTLVEQMAIHNIPKLLCPSKPHCTCSDFWGRRP